MGLRANEDGTTSGDPEREVVIHEETGEVAAGQVTATYWAKVSTFGREFGVACAITAPTLVGDEEAMRQINNAVVLKHRELENAWLASKE